MPAAGAAAGAVGTTQEESKVAVKGSAKKATTKLDGQDRMSIEELKEELEGASERNETRLMISILQSMVKKSFGPRKADLMKQLVVLYRETR